MQKLIVKMEKCVWLVEMTLQEELKFADVVCGVWCVTITGTAMMPELSVDILDYHQNVSNIISYYLQSVSCS